MKTIRLLKFCDLLCSANQWMAVAANDAGTDGDRLAGDSIFTAACPTSMLAHRNLVRFVVVPRWQ
jgi:hypothetical protein